MHKKLVRLLYEKSRFVFMLSAMAVALCASIHQGLAADIGLEPNKIQGYSVIKIVGSIETGDEAKFKNIARQLDKVLVLLSGKGGLPESAISIGKYIRERNFLTAVPSNSDCESMCGFVWLGGVKRFVFLGGRLDFHSKAGNRPIGSPRQFGTELVKYANTLNLPLGVAAYLTCGTDRQTVLIDPILYELKAKSMGGCPSSTHWLTPSKAELLGRIDMYYLPFENEENAMQQYRASLTSLRRVMDAPKEWVSDLEFTEVIDDALVGKDLNGIPVPSENSTAIFVSKIGAFVSDVAACKYHCRTEKKCIAYTLETQSGKCILMSDVHSAIDRKGSTSGYAQKQVSDLAAVQFSMIEDGYLAGKELLSLHNSNYPDCLWRCTKSTKCRGFHVTRDQCFLIEREIKVNAAKGYFAGVRKQQKVQQ